jgi:inorganic pyrophosphatase
MSLGFWRELAALAANSEVVIDRPQGSIHPRYPELRFPLNYGYLAGTTSGDGGGIDVWIGSLGGRQLSGLICSFDPGKRDAEIKLLLGCTSRDIEAILAFNGEHMRYLFLANPETEQGHPL